MTSYSKEFKEKIIIRMLPPNNEPVSKISKEIKISIATLHKWKKSYTAKGKQSSKTTSKDKWSSQDKFLVVMETASMNEIELSKYAYLVRTIHTLLIQSSYFFYKFRLAAIDYLFLLLLNIRQHSL